jgi:hypothetical protein
MNKDIRLGKPMLCEHPDSYSVSLETYNMFIQLNAFSGGHCGITIFNLNKERAYELAQQFIEMGNKMKTEAQMQTAGESPAR